MELTLADRRKVRAKLYLAEVEAEGRRGLVFVAELDVPTPIMGAYALETLGLKPNPLTGRLEVVGPEGYLLRSALFWGARGFSWAGPEQGPRPHFAQILPGFD